MNPTFTFPGVRGVISGNLTFNAAGSAPSVAIIETTPQTSLPRQAGTLGIRYGSVSIVFPDCIIDEGSINFNAGGQILGLSILDRRWKWQFGHISGRYNARNDDNTILQSTERTPQQLASLLLQAMGEQGFSVSQLPNNTRPERVWVYANPATELELLCDELGCVVILDPIDNRTKIYRRGQLTPIPGAGTGVTSNAFGINPAELPGGLLFLGGMTQFQFRWKLEAVGKETDGSVKPIDELSYKPQEGWEKESVRYFSNVLEEHGTDAHKLAQETVFRWYRTTDPASFESVDFQSQRVTPSRKLCLPYLNEKVETYTEQSTGKLVHKPVEVLGEYWDGTEDFKNTESFTAYKDSFSVDTARGIVQFNTPVYKLSTGGEFNNEPADIQVEIGCSMRAREDQTYMRGTFRRHIGGNARDYVHRIDEVNLTFVANYSEAGNFQGWTINQDEFVQSAVRGLNDILSKFNTEQAFTRIYAGLLPIRPSGSVRQISWQFSDAGGFTTVGVNSEFDRLQASQKVRLERSKNAHVQQQVAKTVSQSVRSTGNEKPVE